MPSRFISKLAIVSTVAVMTFGLFSMAVSMEMGMSHCPIMNASSDCLPLSMGASFFNHHIEGFRSMTFAILTAFFTALLIVCAYIGLVVRRFTGPPIPARPIRPDDVGPPSPLASLLFWSALHNKTGYLAPVRVHVFRV